MTLNLELYDFDQHDGPSQLCDSTVTVFSWKNSKRHEMKPASLTDFRPNLKLIKKLKFQM